ncbi:CaiB/BaiF CoA transferase family protein [Sinanaerobacter chloroacetimidivorans]|uniref:CoA transferase n=1 Tax=Sinanaerobacter chloroacetimidivorans TaxID=2818044 RepID=A0A8J7W598_9FIRM|nr:CoA transferase [Sinanaerobacter chloroacetimidivorans]MBR0599358.1 CoA transferase [Sinanaerobacter chloroacetimidivorans]
MKPLEGIRVIDLTTYLAGPGASRILADQGADVIKVEPLAGDPARIQGRLLTCPIKDDENPQFDMENANKKFIAVNLKEKKGLEIIHKLLEDADVLVTNYREDALVKLKLTYEELSVKYPKLVYGHINSFGEKGPDAARPGYDFVAYFGRSGFSLDTVVDGGIPLVNIGGAGDHPTGVALAQGIAAALIKQQRTGKGDKVSVSLYHTAIWTLATLIASTQYNAKYPVQYSEPPLSPVVGHPYKTADGKWMLIMLFDFNKYWEPFCKSIGREDFLTDPKFNTPMGAKINQLELVEILCGIIGSEPYDVWAKKWEAEDIPFEVLRHMSDVPKDEQAVVNNFLHPIHYPSGKTVYLPTPPIQFKEMGEPDYKTSEGIGANTWEILEGLGYGPQEIMEMKENKLIPS